MRKIIFAWLAVFLCMQVPLVHAAPAVEDQRVLIIYTPDEKADVNQARMLDTLVGHFAKRIDVLKDSEWSKVNIQDYTHVLYLGMKEKALSADVINGLETFPGPVFFIGRNGEQFSKCLSFMRQNGMTTIQSASLLTDDTTLAFAEERLAVDIMPDKQTQVLVNGKSKTGKTYPLIVKQKETYYAALESFFNPSGYFFGETLFDFFQAQPAAKHSMYLRLEDIHPKTDPKSLMEMAKFLEREQIPYMIALIPVYVDPKTHQETHLAKAPQLVKTLQYMQDHGGSILLHGYRHQYKHQETGEGFEFWDVDQDRPIWQGNDARALMRKDFETEKAYQQFVKKGAAFEADYIQKAIENGVQELTAHKLYPLAFEAPHYAMSEKGYGYLAKHFSTYVGQLQLSNETWKSEYAPIFKSNPSFLHGMTLLPETIGYVEEGNPKALQEIKENALTYEKFSDGTIAGFYHPYLGIDKLKQLVAELKTVPDTEWLNLKQLNNTTRVGDIHITSKNGEIAVKKDLISSDYEQKLLLRTYTPWVAGALIAITALLFWLFERRKKRAS